VKVRETELSGVLIVDPAVFRDERGFFTETYHLSRYRDCGIEMSFVQDNLSFSRKGTLRGLHYQHPHGQDKLVQVLRGEVFDVVVDIRPDSPTFGRWVSVLLNGENMRQVLVPRGYAHGFYVLSETALFTYKCSDFYHPETEGGIIWNDPDLGIDWPVTAPLLSEKDRAFPRLKDVPKNRLPSWESVS